MAVGDWPETGYAVAHSGRVAYQRSGAGALGILGVKPSMLPVDLMWDEPQLAAFLGRLSRFSCHVWFDQRGSGASQRPSWDAGRFVEDMVEDMVAVLDHLGWEQAAIIGGLGPSELLFAATYPKRTKALVLINGFARAREANGYAGLSDAEVERVAGYHSVWGTGAALSFFAPSMVDDAAFRRWYSRCERLAYSPEHAFARFRTTMAADLRDVLQSVNVPTLVLSRRRCPAASQSRYVADHVEGAKLVELSGDDFLFFVGDTASAVDPIEEFLTGRLPAPDTDRVLATVVFTDVVDSTGQAARLGDRRWRERLAAHDRLVRDELHRHRGREIKTMGDGFLALFDGPARAVRFGCAARDGLAAVGVSVRVGIHTGEVTVDGDVTGIAVHIAQRVQARAAPGEVLVSRTVVDLVAGSDLCFTERGEHDLKGVPEPWRLFAVGSPSPL